jgi:3-deoxy-D-manno-octulosonic acid (KDO) 8-phosphate synthase
LVHLRDILDSRFEEFAEVHENPEIALSDGPNMVYLKDFKTILEGLK